MARGARLSTAARGGGAHVCARARPGSPTSIGAPEPLVRNALLLEDDDDAMARVEGNAELALEEFGNVGDARRAADAARIAFSEAMIGNFDWCLKFSPGRHLPLQRAQATVERARLRRTAAKPTLDDEGLRSRGHRRRKTPWFHTVWNRAFVRVEVGSRDRGAQPGAATRSLFPRAQLDEEREHFLDRKAAITRRSSARQVDNADGDRAALSRQLLQGDRATTRRSTGPSWAARTSRSISIRSGRGRRAQPGDGCGRARRSTKCRDPAG